MTRSAPIDRAATPIARDASPGPRRLSALRPIPRRGLSRTEASMYVGLGTTKFDEMVQDGRMPRPKKVDGRQIWDILALDLAFDQLPDENREASDDWTAAV
jgi:predicted DNA-binding transcriptional regulator AlpA